MRKDLRLDDEFKFQFGENTIEKIYEQKMLIDMIINKDENGAKFVNIS